MTGVTTTILLRNDYSCYVMNQAIQSVPVFIARPHNGKKSVSLTVFFFKFTYPMPSVFKNGCYVTRSLRRFNKRNGGIEFFFNANRIIHIRIITYPTNFVRFKIAS